MSALDTPDPVALALELMRIDSTTGRERELVDFVHRLLERRGWRVRRIPVSEGRDDLHATAGDAPCVTLSTHLDTVPPYIPPRLDGDRLWGRGACDAKGIAAAMLCAAEHLRDRAVPVALLFVVGEETVHDGARAADALAARTDGAGNRAVASRALIDGEPTESTLALGTKGAIRFVMRTRGVAAHSAYPELGHSAIDDLVVLLSELRTLEWPSDPALGATTLNVGRIAGGVADNVVAAWAEAHLMLRVVTPPEEAWGVLQRWVAGRAELERGASAPPVRLGTLDGFPTAVMAYTTDVPALPHWGTPYLFGPGSVRVAHCDDEHVEVAELVAAVERYERLAEAALKKEEQRVTGKE